MRAVDYEFLFNIEEDYWWFVAMRRITDVILAGQAAILTAVQNQPGTNNQAVLDGLAAIKTELDSVSGTISTEAAPTPAPAS